MIGSVPYTLTFNGQSTCEPRTLVDLTSVASAAPFELGAADPGTVISARVPTFHQIIINHPTYIPLFSNINSSRFN